MREPRLRWHRGSRRGFVRKYPDPPIYFKGEWPAPGPPRVKPPREVLQQYLDWLKDWQARQVALHGPAGVDPVAMPPALAGSAAKTNLLIAELWELYDTRNQEYYRKDYGDGKGKRVTSEPGCIRTACRIVDELFGRLEAAKFTAQHLLAVRAHMIQLGWHRNSINQQVSRVRGMFSWAASVEGGQLIPMAVYHGLRDMKGLKYGRCKVPESPRVRPVSWELIERTLPYLGPVVRQIVRVHWLLGCRSQDVVAMRPCDLITDKPCSACGGLLSRGDRRRHCFTCRETGRLELPAWLYYPEHAKTEHHEHLDPLRYRIGPRAQELLRPLLDACAGPNDWVFRCRANRAALGRYTTGSYRYHVTRRIARAMRERPELGIEHWVPRQIRHARLTEIRAAYGMETAKDWAQHQDYETTERYAEVSEEKLQQVAIEIG